MGAALPASSEATSSGGGAARSISGDAGGDEAPWLASMDQSAEFYDAAVGGAPSSSSSLASSKPEYSFKPSNPLVASFAKMMFHSASSATSGISPLEDSKTWGGEATDSVMPSNISSLVDKMSQFYSAHSVAFCAINSFPSITGIQNIVSEVSLRWTVGWTTARFTAKSRQEAGCTTV